VLSTCREGQKQEGIMTLSEIAPNLTPEQIAACEVNIGVNWENKKAKIVLTNESGIVAAKELANTSAPVTRTQGEFWQVHHNPWLD
jgi:hypothetical protein